MGSPLVYKNYAKLLFMVGLPIKKMVIFHGYASFLEGILATGAKCSTPPMSVSGKFTVRP